MLSLMTIMTNLAKRRAGSHLPASRTRRPPPAPISFVSLHLVGGGAPHGNLSGAVRHAIEAHAMLSADQRLSLTAPGDLPRLYTPAEARILLAALLAAGADAVVRTPPSL